MMSNSPGASDSVRTSGRRAVERSNFSHTCSLLSQYLKEKGSFGGINLGISRTFEPKGQRETMDLLPRMEMSGGAVEVKEAASQQNGAAMDSFVERANLEPSAANPSPGLTTVRSEAAQMTMFYAGRVLVFDNFPAEKAKEIMLLASKTMLPSSGNARFETLPGNEHGNSLQRNSDVASTSGSGPPSECLERPLQVDASDLPIARKISLRRFLEKRKGRIAAKAPYQIEERATVAFKPDESKSWLALTSKADSEDS